MSGQKVHAVIGKGFGDEGKGLAVDYFCLDSPQALVIKHNGGAQAGHTVELEDKRFVFHQLSAGSFRHCDTFWAESYYPDLYKLEEEMEMFSVVSGFFPVIHVDLRTPVTLIDDILINMLLESSRGKARHGSCGMGINEAFLRTNAGYGFTVADFLSEDTAKLVKRYLEIRRSYGRQRLAECGITMDGARTSEALEYMELLASETVVQNAVESMQKNADRFVRIVSDTGAFLRGREKLIFETGQGLLLDADYKRFAPHLTTSRTGLFNPMAILKKHGMRLTEAVYVTRSYVTRHGAGPLPHACDKKELGRIETDQTNIENPWQGRIRYARHEDVKAFLEPVREDLETNGASDCQVSLFLTHLNETEKMICMEQGNIPCESFIKMEKVREVFGRFYLSDSKESRGVRRI